MNNKTNKPIEDSTRGELVSISSRIPIDLDIRLVVAVARERVTKQDYITSAIRRAVEASEEAA